MTGKEIKALRVRLGLSHEAFARKLGVGISTVQRWQSGESRPTGLSREALRRLDRRGKP